MAPKKRSNHIADILGSRWDPVRVRDMEMTLFTGPCLQRRPQLVLLSCPSLAEVRTARKVAAQIEPALTHLFVVFRSHSTIHFSQSVVDAARETREVEGQGASV